MGVKGSGMKIEESSLPGGVEVLRLSGEIDLHTSPGLRKAMQGKLKAKTPALILDFGGVEYIDSSGLATLVEYRRDCAAFGGKFALAGLSTGVRTIFDLVRLNELLAIHDSVAAAQSALVPGSGAATGTTAVAAATGAVKPTDLAGPV